ncbi:hypothetical protein K493DRAFT_318495 [Basidiobolus meristosporus CBS 931.73]|uniref:DUF6787 domain-containing protein n=1 Tax=Basidiobolus meristosporus CBS 931.73 TaxID=1314790 RepID=A0A1Y1XVE8_9FUNG|nr:hypothetical protein K493DRAFT_318495 [Basidiobolus meristosporus CBS 931.73]|eukprot:ORX89720.1 hypothetical protein K493DRAFT_318495 [Basidiobolus meristosporus CBS 931.73]
MTTQEQTTLLPTHSEESPTTGEPSRSNNSEVLHWVLVLLVFTLAGSTTARVVSPLLHALGIQGGFLAGPWSFRILYIVIMTLCYPFILLFFGTVFGKRQYFIAVVRRMARHLNFRNFQNSGR